MGVGSAAVFAPVPDFRYVGLEPVDVGSVGLPSGMVSLLTAASMTLSGAPLARTALTAAALGVGSAMLLRGVRRGSTSVRSRGARMGIVPWGVLVDADDGPRILRWSALRSVDVRVSRAPRILTKGWPSSRVVVETEQERWVGQAVGTVPLAQLVEHLAAYAHEQATPLALDLRGDGAKPVLEASEPCVEALIAAARAWVTSAEGIGELGLPALDYRRPSALSPSPRAVEVLRHVLRDRTPKVADPRAFAAVVAAEIHARELAPELCALTLCPHPLVAAVAKQAAHKLDVPRPKVGLLEENAPFLFELDCERLEAWIRKSE